MKNYYQILDIEQSADQRAIRKAWLKKAQRFHPDHNPDDPTAEEMFKDAQEAYRILSDPFLRNRYDLGGFTSLVNAPPVPPEIHYYFYANTRVNTIRQFDEFPITFTYTGRGRVFRKPSFLNFFVTGSPYVSHRMVLLDGYRIKETTFTYLICPMITGDLVISPASIRIENTVYKSESIPVTVTRNTCHFTNDESSDGKPLKLTLHYFFREDDMPYRISEQKKNHVVLIPRSRTAFLFHNIGMAMKLTFMLWGGIVLGYYLDIPFLLGCLVGNLLGGINCMIMYRFAGVKSKFLHARRYPTVKEYLDKGYYLGESTGIPMIKGNFFYNLNKILR